MQMAYQSLSSLSVNAFIPSHEHGQDIRPSNLSGRFKRDTLRQEMKLSLIEILKTLKMFYKKWREER